MKKFIVLAVALFAAAAVYAQPRAIGGRLGYGFEASYQHIVGGNMITLDVGFHGFGGISAASTYDWLFPIEAWDEKGEFNWFVGCGAGLGFNFVDGGAFFVGVAGRIGVEYNFWFPLNLFLDWRPVIGPVFAGGNAYYYSDGLYSGAIALGARYMF